jgi:hypothetical protein
LFPPLCDLSGRNGVAYLLKDPLDVIHRYGLRRVD